MTPPHPRREGEQTMPRERPILFSAPMIRAIRRAENPKTQTRRIVRPTGDGIHFSAEVTVWRGIHACPYGVPGDRLWVREALRCLSSGRWVYDADGEPVLCSTEFQNAMRVWVHHKDAERCNSIHMPRWASRITLELLDVRAQRVQDISEADAIAEGFPAHLESPADRARHDQSFAELNRCTNGTIPACPAVAWYRMLWIEINGFVWWARNDWVFALTFKTVEQKGART